MFLVVVVVVVNWIRFRRARPKSLEPRDRKADKFSARIFGGKVRGTIDERARGQQ